MMLHLAHKRANADETAPGAFSGRDCVIALAGVDLHDRMLLSSMLDLLVGRTSGHWRLGETREADVLMFGNDAPDALLESWRVGGKPWVAILDHNDNPTTASHVLHRPVRVFPLLSLLREIEDETGSAGPAPAKSSPSAVPDHWQFANELRSLGLGSHHAGWHRAGDIWVRNDGQQFAANDDDLRRMRKSGLSELRLVDAMSAPPPALRLHPIEELAWCIGWWSDANQLAPWLDRSMRFRLRHWPDLGTVEVAQPAIRLLALLAQRSWTVEELVGASGNSPTDVLRALNATAVSGLLLTRAGPPKPAPAPVAGFLGSLLRGIRSRLGLS
jgi:hypothetical protein